MVGGEVAHLDLEVAFRIGPGGIPDLINIQVAVRRDSLDTQVVDWLVGSVERTPLELIGRPWRTIFCRKVADILAVARETQQAEQTTQKIVDPI